MPKNAPFLILGVLLFVAGCVDASSQGEDQRTVLAASTESPVEDRFTKVVFDENLFEPMELDLLDDGRILFIERRGAVKIYDPQKGETETIAEMDVFSKFEEGLIGVALDPDYAANRWVYINYSAPDEAVIRVARFVLEGSTLDFDSEKILLEIPVQREECCHVGGSLEFGPDGNLYIAIGDNTNPFASDGFAPIDEREGRSPWDAQKSSANTNDLRGKIMRIKPEADGTYSIPDGNLFPKDGSVGRPEIYVMGNRNPFRLSIDSHTGYLYWGEVGPDAGEDGPTRGPRGHDEVNQARQAGNFGWPHFVGNNKPYFDYNFETETSGERFDPNNPVNNSPNNTGAAVLPPAQPAFIWYPYGPSEAFPLAGEGGRNAMAGPVYHHGDYAASDRKFPAYYDGKLFIYDWMRGWIMTVAMDDNGDFVKMEPFMPNTTFNNPMDMLFGPDGALYMLEYGTGWFTQNADARLIRIEYAVNNRAPVALITADNPIGAAPLAVSLSAAESRDPDGDAVTYAWAIGDDAVPGTDAGFTFTFEEPGTYTARLTVTDAQGASATDELDLLVGNDIPGVTLEINGNRSFFWDNGTFDYDVVVADTEDGSLEGGGIAPEQVALTFDYLAQGADLTIPAQGHQAALENASALVGKVLIDGSDCQACHKTDEVSIGPSYTAIAQRYQDDTDAPAYLAEKIIQGGGGVWGTQAMAAHPQLAQDEVTRMVDYILTLAGDAETAPGMPLRGTYATAEHVGSGEEGRYIIAATYTDRGADGIGPLTGRDVVTLRHPRLQAETFDEADKAQTFPAPEDTPGLDGPADVVLGTNDAYFTFRNIDLTGVRALSAQIGTMPETTTGGRIEVRLGSPSGRTIGSFVVAQTPESAGFKIYEAALEPTAAVVDLVFVFVQAEHPEAEAPVCAVDWIYFSNFDARNSK